LRYRAALKARLFFRSQWARSPFPQARPLEQKAFASPAKQPHSSPSPWPKRPTHYVLGYVPRYFNLGIIRFKAFLYSLQCSILELLRKWLRIKAGATPGQI